MGFRGPRKMSVIIPGIDGQNNRISVQPQNVSWLRLRISGSIGEEGLRHRPWVLREEGPMVAGHHVQPGGPCQIYVSQGGEARNSKLCVRRKKRD